MIENSEMMGKVLSAYVVNPPEGSVAETLQDHQMEIVGKVAESWQRGQRGYVKEPTGGGKTRVAAAVVDGIRGAFPNQRALVVVERQDHIDQFQAEFSGVRNTTVTPYFADKKDTTGDVVITTYPSLLRGLAKQSLIPDHYGIVVWDEAHHGLSPRRQAAADTFKDAKHIGLTATPGYGKNHHVREYLHNEISSASIRQRVESDRLASFSVFIVKTGLNIGDVRITGASTSKERDFEEGALQRAVNTAARNHAAVDMYQQSFSGRKTIAYAAGIDHARALAEMFRDAGVRAEYIHGKIKGKKEILKRYRAGEIDVLCNADLLIEGFDDKPTSVILNLRPTLSPRLAEQRGGRALRLDPANPGKYSYIVDFIDETDGSNNPISFAQVAEAAQIVNTWHRSEGKSQPANTITPVILDLKGAEVLQEKSEVMWVVNEISGMDFEIEEGWKTLRRISAESGIPMDTLKMIEQIMARDFRLRPHHVFDFQSPHGDIIRHFHDLMTITMMNYALLYKGYRMVNPVLEETNGDPSQLYYKIDSDDYNFPSLETSIIKKIAKVDPIVLMTYVHDLFERVGKNGIPVGEDDIEKSFELGEAWTTLGRVSRETGIPMQTMKQLEVTTFGRTYFDDPEIPIRQILRSPDGEDFVFYSNFAIFRLLLDFARSQGYELNRSEFEKFSKPKDLFVKDKRISTGTSTTTPLSDDFLDYAFYQFRKMVETENAKVPQ